MGWSQEEVGPSERKGFITTHAGVPEGRYKHLAVQIPAVTETIKAGTLRLDIRIDGQYSGERPGAWYNTPRLHLLITG